jgi:hypothetical protein
MVALHVAATVVTLIQYFRCRERRLLALAGLFVFSALAGSREAWDPWRDGFQVAALVSGLVLLVGLSSQGPAAR